MEKYTVLYSRVSTGRQAEQGTSLDYQDEVLWAKAKELGEPDHLIKVFREEGVSGEDIDRPKMNEVRDLIAKEQVKRIIIVHPDRLSRNMVDRLVVCAEFEKYGVELMFLDTEFKDSEEGRLFFNIQSSISSYELALIKKRTRRGTIKRVQDGYVMPMRYKPYGYDYADKQLHINEKEAPFVRKIFEWYVYDKLTMREIGEKLCALGATPKTKNIPEWSASSIQKILKNEMYIGKYYYNRRKVKKVKGEKTVSGKPKREYSYRDKEEWLEVSIPSIVDPATFLLAQEQREKNAKHSGNVKHEYLLRMKIRCGHCGNKYSSFTTTNKTKNKDGEVTSTHTYKRYRCTNRQHRKFGEGIEKCDSKIINANIIEEYIWENLIMKVINNTDQVIENMKNKFEKPSKEIEETYNLLKFKIAKMEEEKKRLIQLFKKAYIDEEEMDRDMKQIQSGIKDLKKEMDKYEQQMFNVGKNELNIQMLKEQIEQVRNLIENEDEKISFKTKRQVIDTFVDEIVLKWNEDELNVVTVGVINLLDNSETLRDLSTQRESFVDTNNVVFNLLFETLFSIDSTGRDTDYRVKRQELKIS